jgi:hypothetical protein
MPVPLVDEEEVLGTDVVVGGGGVARVVGDVVGFEIVEAEHLLGDQIDPIAAVPGGVTSRKVAELEHGWRLHGGNVPHLAATCKRLLDSFP